MTSWLLKTIFLFQIDVICWLRQLNQFYQNTSLLSSRKIFRRCGGKVGIMNRELGTEDRGPFFCLFLRRSLSPRNLLPRKRGAGSGEPESVMCADVINLSTIRHPACASLSSDYLAMLLSLMSNSPIVLELSDFIPLICTALTM